MAEHLNVVELRPADNPHNIPEHLRLLAKEIEDGDIDCKRMFVIIPVQDDNPVIFGWGECMDAANCVMDLEIAKMSFITGITRRK